MMSQQADLDQRDGGHHDLARAAEIAEVHGVDDLLPVEGVLPQHVAGKRLLEVAEQALRAVGHAGLGDPVSPSSVSRMTKVRSRHAVPMTKRSSVGDLHLERLSSEMGDYLTAASPARNPYRTGPILSGGQ